MADPHPTLYMGRSYGCCRADFPKPSLRNRVRTEIESYPLGAGIGGWMIKMRRSVLAPLVVGTMALATGGWFLQRGVDQDSNVYIQAKLFDEVVHRVSDSFVDKKDPSQLYQMAIDGLLEQWREPTTTFRSPKDYGDLKVQTRGEYGGLGMQIDKRDGWITVVAPLPGTPAERAGVLSGDQITEFNGQTTKDWTESQA